MFRSGPYAVMLWLAIAHFMVDAIATSVSPLWTHMESKFKLEEGDILWVYVVWVMTTSLTQLAFGWLAEHIRSVWLLWVGPIFATVSLGLVGYALNPSQLALLITFAGVGIAAFHPEGAATAGSLLSETNRSRSIAVFALSGYVGQAIGPSYGGYITKAFGDRSLVFGIPIVIACFLLIRAKLQAAEVTSSTSKKTTDKSPRRIPWKMFCLLLVMGTTRVTPVLGIPLVLNYVLKDDDGGTAYIGWIQSCFMGGIGIGGILCALGVNRAREALAISVPPLLGSALLWMMVADESYSMLPAKMILLGSLFGISLPIMTSLAQQACPAMQRFASSVTMGASWGIGSGVVALVIRYHQDQGEVEMTFVTLSAVGLTSCLLSFLCALLIRRAHDK